MRVLTIIAAAGLAAAVAIAAVRSLNASDVETWIIYDVRPWLNWDGKQPAPPVGEELRVQPRRINADA